MDLKSAFRYLWCVIVWITNFGLINSSESKCHRVRTEFINRKIGPSHLVPDNPIHDSGIRICFNGALDPERQSCCTKNSEDHYILAAQKYLKDNVKAKNAPLKKLILDHISEFEERISTLITSSENRTGILLQDIYLIPRKDYIQPVTEFFSQLRLFMKQKHISLYAAVATFYDNIFPSVFKHYLNNGSIVTLTQDQEKCLQSNRQDLTPQPFGHIPYNISHSLNRALTNVKLYLEVLSLIVEAINSTDFATVTEKCIHQVTKLQFCSHCSNETNISPCKGLCLNTMRRCLAQFSVLHREWNGLIMSVVRLEGGQSQRYNVESILKNLDYNIDTSIGFAEYNSGKLIQSAKETCYISIPHSVGPPKTAASQLRSQLNKGRERRSINGDLYDKILTVMKELLTNLHMFNTVSDDICGQEILYDQQLESTKCWNGTAVGKFTANIEKLEAFTSSEMAVDAKLTLMRDKLATMKQTLQDRQEEDDSMMSDSRVIKYASGDRELNLGNGIKLETDDEDLNGSGSGSGDGSGDDEPTEVDVTIRPPAGFHPDTKTTKPTGFANHVTVSMVTIVLTVLLSSLFV